MLDVHDLWEAKIKHVLKSPTWEYECNNVATTAHRFNKIPNLEYELLSAINEQQTKDTLQDSLDVHHESGELDSLTPNPTDQLPPRRHSIDVCECGDIEADLDQHISRSKKKAVKKKRRGSGVRRIEPEEGTSTYCSHEWVEDDYLPQMVDSPRCSDTSDDDEDDDLVPVDMSPLANEYDPSLFRGYSSEDGIEEQKHIDPMRNEKSEETYEIEEKATYRLSEDENDVCTPLTCDVEEPPELTLFGSQEWSDRPAYEDEEAALTPMTPVVDKIKKLSLCGRDGYCFTFVSDGDDEEDVDFSRTPSSDIETTPLGIYSDDAESPLYPSHASDTNFYDQDSLETPTKLI